MTMSGMPNSGSLGIIPKDALRVRVFSELSGVLKSGEENSKGELERRSLSTDPKRCLVRSSSSFKDNIRNDSDVCMKPAFDGDSYFNGVCLSPSAIDSVALAEACCVWSVTVFGGWLSSIDLNSCVGCFTQIATLSSGVSYFIFG